jgi:hypothetical protein
MRFTFLTPRHKAVVFGDNQIVPGSKLPAIALSSSPTCTYSIIMSALAVTHRSSSYFWLHWREVNLVDGDVYYRMEPTESAHLHKVMDVALSPFWADSAGETGQEERVTMLDNCVELAS